MNLSVMEFEMNRCRYPYCNKPANIGHSCCSIECRNKIPTCDVYGCNNAPEVGIYKGMYTHSAQCYNHGGRLEYDGIPLEHEYLEHSKEIYLFNNGEWILKHNKNIACKPVYDSQSRLYICEINK
jgi:hypothetical protein